jgi:PAS domain-containing protein
MLALTVADLDPQQSPQRWTEHWSELKAKGALTLETQHKTKAGSLMDVEISANYIFFEGQELNCAIIRNITSRKRLERELRANERRMASLFDISQYSFTNKQEFLDHALNEVIGLTESKIGYIFLYDEQSRQFTLNTWSHDVMRECSVLDQKTIYDLDSTGIWGEAVRQRKPIMLNDFQAHNQLKKGYPEGHVDLIRFLTVPIIVDEAIIAVVGVANKEDNYTDMDVMQLKLFMDSVWMIAKRKQAEEELREKDEKLRTILQAAIDGFWIVDTNGRLLEVNEAYCRISGYSTQELLTKCISDLESRETVAETVAHMQKIM